MSRVVTYEDPLEGFRGYVVYDRDDCRIAAGGCRVQRGLTAETLQMLAGRMTLKQRTLGLNVDGAKCGIDYDAASPTKEAALRRFLAFLRDELATRLSMGCDMGTQWNQLERLAAAEGIPSVKYAIKTAQELSAEEFTTRLGRLDEPVGPLTLGQRRAGHALAAAALTAADHLGVPRRGLRCALQGFGNLGRAAACTLVEGGARLVAVADEFGCVTSDHGLDVSRMLSQPQSAPVTEMAVEGRRLDRDAVLTADADVLVLAAGENAIALELVPDVRAAAVAVGANHGLGAAVEQALLDRGVVVVPDFVAGIGGPASMEALFGPVETPTPQQTLDSVSTIMRELVTDVLAGAATRGVPPRTVAEDIAANALVSRDSRPYGTSPYLTSGRPRGRRWSAQASHLEVR